MLKKAILIYVVATIAGIASAIFITAFSYNKMIGEEIAAWKKVFTYDNTFEMESNAKTAYEYSLLAEENDYDGILNYSCIRLSIALKYFDTTVYEDFPEKKMEIEDFFNIAQSREVELRELGYCEGWE